MNKYQSHAFASTVLPNNQDDQLTKHGVDVDEEKVLKKKAKNCDNVQRSYYRKKKYVEDLEDLNKKLTQELQEVKSHINQYMMLDDKTIIFPPSNESDITNYAELYKAWFVEHGNLISRLRTQMVKDYTDKNIEPILQSVEEQFKELFVLKKSATKDDVLNIIYGNWMTPVERCIKWIGGFRPSDIIKLILVQVDLPTSQTTNIKEWEKYCIGQETDLSNRIMEVETSIAQLLTSKSFRHTGDDSYYQNYMSNMLMSMGKLRVMEDVLHQADQLRASTMAKFNKVLTTKPLASTYLAINQYLQRTTALSILWISRPRV